MCREPGWLPRTTYLLLPRGCDRHALEAHGAAANCQGDFRLVTAVSSIQHIVTAWQHIVRHPPIHKGRLEGLLDTLACTKRRYGCGKAAADSTRTGTEQNRTAVKATCVHMMAGLHADPYERQNISEITSKKFTWLSGSNRCQEQNRNYNQHRVSWISQGSLGCRGTTANEFCFANRCFCAPHWAQLNYAASACRTIGVRGRNFCQSPSVCVKMG
jgi:hypothetical protein